MAWTEFGPNIEVGPRNDTARMADILRIFKSTLAAYFLLLHELGQLLC